MVSLCTHKIYDDPQQIQNLLSLVVITTRRFPDNSSCFKIVIKLLEFSQILNPKTPLVTRLLIHDHRLVPENYSHPHSLICPLIIINIRITSSTRGLIRMSQLFYCHPHELSVSYLVSRITVESSRLITQLHMTATAAASLLPQALRLIS